MKKIIALAIATAISAPVMADLTIGASARYQIDDAADGASENRVIVSVAGSTTTDSGLFVSAKGALKLANDGTVGQDGGRELTIGNAAANVVLGNGEPAGVYSKGVDLARVGGGALQERALGRDIDNVIVNITAVEGLTAQFSGNFNNSKSRVVLGTDMGGVALSAGLDNATGADAYQLKASTSFEGVGVTLSYEDQSDADTTLVNLGATYNGFSVNYENQDVAGTETSGVYGAYAVSNVGGLDGLNVTLGLGNADGASSKAAVRLDYAF